MVDLFGDKIEKDPILRDKFIEPPFSVLDSKNGNWRSRVKKWKSLGIKSELGRENTGTKNGNLQRLIAKSDHNPSRKDNVSIFDPALAELIYNWFCPKNGYILDPFSGGSVRGIVANYLCYKYTGIDIRQEQIDSNREQALKILPVYNQPQWYAGDSNIVLDTGFGHDFDLIFTCPPYADLEVYSDLQGDISNMKYDDFLSAYKSIIKKSIQYLKNDSFVVIVVSEVRNKKGIYYGLVPDTIKISEELNLKYYNECIYLNGLAGACLTAGRVMGISKKVKKVHQNVLIFKK